MSKPLQAALDLWCHWCVDHERFVPFEEWKHYTLPPKHPFGVKEHEGLAPGKPLSNPGNIDENSIRDHSAEGIVFVRRVCIYIMGTGAEQCEASFPTSVPCTPEGWETCRKLITQTFGVTRILKGVG